MKKVKQIMVLFLSIIMIITSSNIMVYAAEEPTIKLSSVEGKTGETVDVYFEVANNPGIVSMTVDVSFDETVLKMVSVENTEKMPGWQSEIKEEYHSPYTLMWMNDASKVNLTHEGVFAKLTFEIVADKPCETYIGLSVEEEGIVNKEWDEIPFTFVKGKVTVVEEPVPITGISISPKNPTVYVGQNLELTAKIMPENQNEGFTWTSSAPDVVSIPADSADKTTIAVTGLKEGTSTITVKANNSDFSASCVVTVEKAPCEHKELVEVPAVEPTCEKEGNNLYYVCKNEDCRTVFKADKKTVTTVEAETLAKVDHSYIEKVDEKYLVSAANCSSPAVYKMSCKWCGIASETETFKYGEKDPNNHTLEKVEEVAATCKTEGNIEYWHCTGCDKNFEDEKGTTEVENVKTPVNPNNHTLEKVEAKNPTCQDEGNVEYWKCKECGKLFADEDGTTETTIEKVTIPADSSMHTGGTATCTKKAICSACGKEYGEFDPDNHVNTKLIYVEEATCEKEGYSGDLYCIDEDKIVKSGEKTPMIDHNPEHHEAKEATCSTEGNREYWQCSACEKYFSDKDCKEATTLSAVTIAKDPNNHAADADAKWYSDNTNHWKYCGCDNHEVVEKAKHTESNWIIDKQPTTSTTGSKYKECTVCGKVLATEIIPVVEDDEDNRWEYDFWRYQMQLAKLRNTKYTITVDAGKGGSITSGTGSNTVKYDNSITYTITPDDGYAIKAVYVNNQYVGKIDEYTFKNVKSNQKIKATFEQVEDLEPAITAVDTATEPAIVEKEWVNPFVDVANDAEYIDAIEFVYENQLFKGVSDDQFAPDTTMTRAMFVTVLGRMSGVAAENYTETSFDDVVAGEWYAPYVEWAAQNSIVLGYGDGTFGVNNKITVEQAAVILARYAEYTASYTASEATLNEYTDAETVSAWALEAVKWASENGIYNGKNGMLDPQTPASRALIATMIYNYAENIEADVK